MVWSHTSIPYLLQQGHLYELMRRAGRLLLCVAAHSQRHLQTVHAPSFKRNEWSLPACRSAPPGMLAGHWQAASFDDEKPLRCRELMKVDSDGGASKVTYPIIKSALLLSYKILMK